MAIDFFLSIPDLVGPSQVSGFVGQFQLDSFSTSFDETISTSGGGIATGKTIFNGLQVTLPMSSDLVKAFQSLCQGNTIGITRTNNMVLSVVTIGSGSGKPVVTQRITMNEVYVKSYSIVTDAPEVAVTLDLVFPRVHLFVTTLKANGSSGTPVQYGFDVIAGRDWHP